MKRQKRFSNLSRWAFFVCLSLLVAIGQARGAELVSPSTIDLKTNETQPSENSSSPLDALKDSWSKLKDELKASSADSEALLSLLEEAWIEIDELSSLLTQSMERSSALQSISESLGHILDAQDNAHKKEVLRLEIERGWWIAGTATASVLVVMAVVAWAMK